MAKSIQLTISDVAYEKLEEMAKERNLTIAQLFVKGVKDLQRYEELKTKLEKIVKEL